MDQHDTSLRDRVLASTLVVVIDNYDSFVYNLVHYIQEMGYQVRVFKHDEVTLDTLSDLAPRAILLSPGPGAPKEAGICLEVVRALGPTIPLLGICLGHQAIGEAWGGEVGHAKYPLHGKASLLEFVKYSCSERSVFDYLDSTILEHPHWVGRYHSLIVDKNSLPKELCVTAMSTEQEVMALEHRSYPTVGYQFHPESILTIYGRAYLQAFFEWSAVRLRALL